MKLKIIHTRSHIIDYIVVALLGVFVFKMTHPEIEAGINFYPINTDFNIPKDIASFIKFLFIIIAIFSTVVYVYMRSLIAFFLIPLIGVVKVGIGSDMFMHKVFEINESKYANVKNILHSKPMLIPVFTNYINNNCEMNKINYRKFINLSNRPYLHKDISTLPKKPWDNNTQKSCQKKFGFNL